MDHRICSQIDVFVFFGKISIVIELPQVVDDLRVVVEGESAVIRYIDTAAIARGYIFVDGTAIHCEGSTLSDIHTAALTSVAALTPVFGNEAAVHYEGSILSDIHTAARALLF